MRIFLDDLRPAPFGWIRTKSIKEAIKLLSNYNVTEISLDHDLGDDADGNGYDVLCWIEEHVALSHYTPPVIHIHTDNPSARKKMALAIQNLNKLKGKVNGK